MLLQFLHNLNLDQTLKSTYLIPFGSADLFELLPSNENTSGYLEPLEDNLEASKNPFDKDGISEVDTKKIKKIEEEVNVAIEFFPGRVKRDEWVKQASELAK